VHRDSPHYRDPRETTRQTRGGWNTNKGGKEVTVFKRSRNFSGTNTTTKKEGRPGKNVSGGLGGIGQMYRKKNKEVLYSTVPNGPKTRFL